MKQDNSIETGFHLAQKITKQYAKTYYFASRFLPKEKRYPAYAVYAICRIGDEAVDSLQAAPLASLTKIKESIDLAYSNIALKEDLLLSFRHTVNQFNIPKKYFDELIEGMRMDLEINRYETFDDLYTYCYRVAGLVGLIMLKILGTRQQQAEKYAVDLGVAMQLTNIIRDIKEDLSRGRVYLPQEELKKFGVTQEGLFSGEFDENFKSLLKFQINRARHYYTSCEQGIKFIEHTCCRFVVLCMKEIYATILDSIKRSGYDVFSKRHVVPGWAKAGIALKIMLGGRYL